MKDTVFYLQSGVQESYRPVVQGFGVMGVVISLDNDADKEA